MKLLEPFKTTHYYVGYLLLRVLTMDDFQLIVSKLEDHPKLHHVLYEAIPAMVATERYKMIAEVLKAIPTKKRSPYTALVYAHIGRYGIDRIRSIDSDLLRKTPRLKEIRSVDLWEELDPKIIPAYHLVVSPSETLKLVLKRMKEGAGTASGAGAKSVLSHTEIWRKALYDGYDAWAREYSALVAE